MHTISIKFFNLVFIVIVNIKTIQRLISIFFLYYGINSHLSNNEIDEDSHFIHLICSSLSLDSENSIIFLCDFLE